MFSLPTPWDRESWASRSVVVAINMCFQIAHDEQFVMLGRSSDDGAEFAGKLVFRVVRVGHGGGGGMPYMLIKVLAARQIQECVTPLFCH